MNDLIGGTSLNISLTQNSISMDRGTKYYSKRLLSIVYGAWVWYTEQQKILTDDDIDDSSAGIIEALKQNAFERLIHHRIKSQKQDYNYRIGVIFHRLILYRKGLSRLATNTYTEDSLAVGSIHMRLSHSEKVENFLLKLLNKKTFQIFKKLQERVRKKRKNYLIIFAKSFGLISQQFCTWIKRIHFFKQQRFLLNYSRNQKNPIKLKATIKKWRRIVNLSKEIDINDSKVVRFYNFNIISNGFYKLLEFKEKRKNVKSMLTVINRIDDYFISASYRRVFINILRFRKLRLSSKKRLHIGESPLIKNQWKLLLIYFSCWKDCGIWRKLERRRLRLANIHKRIYKLHKSWFNMVNNIKQLKKENIQKRKGFYHFYDRYCLNSLVSFRVNACNQLEKRRKNLESLYFWKFWRSEKAFINWRNFVMIKQRKRKDFYESKVFYELEKTRACCRSLISYSVNQLSSDEIRQRYLSNIVIKQWIKYVKRKKEQKVKEKEFNKFSKISIISQLIDSSLILRDNKTIHFMNENKNKINHLYDNDKKSRVPAINYACNDLKSLKSAANQSQQNQKISEYNEEFIPLSRQKPRNWDFNDESDNFSTTSTITDSKPTEENLEHYWKISYNSDLQDQINQLQVENYQSQTNSSLPLYGEEESEKNQTYQLQLDVGKRDRPRLPLNNVFRIENDKIIPNFENEKKDNDLIIGNIMDEKTLKAVQKVDFLIEKLTKEKCSKKQIMNDVLSLIKDLEASNISL